MEAEVSAPVEVKVSVPVEAEVSVPATIANLGPGFDALALAVTIHDRFRVALSDHPAVSFAGEGAGALSALRHPLVQRAADAVAAAASRSRQAFRIEVQAAIPICRGLGSSAAAIVGGLIGANQALGCPIDRRRLLDMAVEMEGHADNVTAALAGGMVVVARGEGGMSYARFLPRLDLDIVLAIPDLEVPTQKARALLPHDVPLTDAVFNVARAAMLVAALLGGEESLLPAALDDRLHQPYRAALIPGLREVFAAAVAAGGAGAVLAGSGSTVVALALAERSAAVGEAMCEAFARHGVAARAQIAQVDGHGAVVHE